MNVPDFTTAQELLDRYFAGESSLADEARLRAYFAGDDVDPRHQSLQPLFAYWAAAAEVTAPPAKTPVRKPARTRSLRWVLSAAAAVLLLLVANAWCNRQPAQTAGGPYAGSAFPIEPATQPKTIDWSKYEVSADEEGYRALRGALKTASTALNQPATTDVIRELDKLGARLR